MYFLIKLLLCFYRSIYAWEIRSKMWELKSTLVWIVGSKAVLMKEREPFWFVSRRYRSIQSILLILIMESERTQMSEKMRKASGDYIKTIEGGIQPTQVNNSVVKLNLDQTKKNWKLRKESSLRVDAIYLALFQ